MTKAVVVGASGYIGGEVTRLLLGHPNVTLIAATAHEQAGKPLAEVHPNLRGATDLALVTLDAAPRDADVYVLALPHGEAAAAVAKLPPSARVVDTSQDHRAEWTYGLPEIAREKIARSTRVAAPGCFATASILAVWPLRKHVAGRVILDGKTGSSGAGAKPGPKTHHPFRATSLFGYEPFHHRHVPEIERALGVPVLFQPHSTPLVRGILVTAYVPLKPGVDVGAAFREAYGGAKFIRLGEAPTNPHDVAYSNFADIGWAAEGETAIVWVAIDNLLKGGAGQAVQCLNLMFGWPEETGLWNLPASC